MGLVCFHSIDTVTPWLLPTNYGSIRTHKTAGGPPTQAVRAFSKALILPTFGPRYYYFSEPDPEVVRRRDPRTHVPQRHSAQGDSFAS
jgi:hypothetical protein